MHTSEYDVVVIGGGPGGSTASTLLAQHGLKVGLFEREKFPRFHIGESLIPETYWVLEAAQHAAEDAAQPLRQEVQRAVRQRQRQAVGAVLLLGQQAARVLADVAGRAQRVRPDDARQRARARRRSARRRPRRRRAVRGRSRVRRAHQGSGRRRPPRDPRQGRRRCQRAGGDAAEPVQAAAVGSGAQQGGHLDLLAGRLSRHRPRRRRDHGAADGRQEGMVLVHPAPRRHRQRRRRRAVRLSLQGPRPATSRPIDEEVERCPAIKERVAKATRDYGLLRHARLLLSLAPGGG